MFALIAFIISALLFLCAALAWTVGTLRVVDWGLFFLVVGLLLSYGVPWYEKRRARP